MADSGHTGNSAGASGKGSGLAMPSALARVAAAVGGIEVVGRLAELSGSDFTSLMLEVARRRAAGQTPASVLRRYRSDRFVSPAGTSWHDLRRAEDVLAGNLPEKFEVLTLAPLAPLGTHSVLGPVSQDKLVTCMRACEVAADPTNALALEAAVRRLADQRGAVRLAAFQRVVRAPLVVRSGSLSHFSLLGLVTAGRDDGGHRFEREAVTEHLGIMAAGLAAAGLAPAQLALTPLSATGEGIAEAVRSEFDRAGTEVVMDRERQAGRGYYRDLCFKIEVRGEGTSHELGDGGFTDWAARLTASNKERLLISGLGIDRLAWLMAGHA